MATRKEDRQAKWITWDKNGWRWWRIPNEENLLFIQGLKILDIWKTMFQLCYNDGFQGQIIHGDELSFFIDSFNPVLYWSTNSSRIDFLAKVEAEAAFPIGRESKCVTWHYFIKMTGLQLDVRPNSFWRVSLLLKLRGPLVVKTSYLHHLNCIALVLSTWLSHKGSEPQAEFWLGVKNASAVPQSIPSVLPVGLSS